MPKIREYSTPADTVFGTCKRASFPVRSVLLFYGESAVMNYLIEHGWPRSRQEQQTRPPEVVDVFICVTGIDSAIFQAKRFLDAGQTVWRIKNANNEIILDQEAVWRRVYCTSDEI